MIYLKKYEYDEIFFNELLINEKISNSKFASNFPKLFTSGYYNGHSSYPMHIFEYLGKNVLMEKWDMDKVYKVIKARVTELHNLGITHNDIRILNIHVSVSGKISLIDFGLSDYDNNQERKIRDLETLDDIFEVCNDQNIKNEGKNEIKEKEDRSTLDISGFDLGLQKKNYSNS